MDTVNTVFSIWIQPKQKNVKYVFISGGHEVFSARDVLFKSSSEVVIAGFWHFICPFKMEWKPHPLCPQMETNSGNTGITVEIP